MYLFIINPTAGKGDAVSLSNKIQKLLKEKHIEFIGLQSSSEKATKDFITEQFSFHAIRAVVVIGGDGTTSSIIQYLALKNVPIAIFPTGSGNDTARMLRLTHDPVLFVEGLLKEHIKEIDLIKVNNRFGITIAGIGIDSMIGNRVNKSFYKKVLNKLKLGSLNYTIATVLSLFTFQPFTAYVTIDGDQFTLSKSWLIACGNTISYGGGLTICPQAIPTDGLLNMTMLHDVGRLNILLNLFPKLLKGKPIHAKGVTYKIGQEIVIETDRLIPVIIDGEIHTTSTLHIAIHKSALKVIVTD